MPHGTVSIFKVIREPNSMVKELQLLSVTRADFQPNQMLTLKAPLTLEANVEYRMVLKEN